MAFDEALAARIRNLLTGTEGVAEKRMFGGLAFLLNGNMCCGVHGDEVILRIDPESAGDALREAHVRVFDMTGRPMKGWLLVDPPGHRKAADLRRWVGRGTAFARTLPPK